MIKYEYEASNIHAATLRRFIAYDNRADEGTPRLRRVFHFRPFGTPSTKDPKKSPQCFTCM